MTLGSMRRCTACRVLKPADAFSPKQGRCRPCLAAAVKARRNGGPAPGRRALELSEFSPSRDAEPVQLPRQGPVGPGVIEADVLSSVGRLGLDPADAGTVALAVGLARQLDTLEEQRHYAPLAARLQRVLELLRLSAPVPSEPEREPSPVAMVLQELRAEADGRKRQGAEWRRAHPGGLVLAEREGPEWDAHVAACSYCRAVVGPRLAGCRLGDGGPMCQCRYCRDMP